MLNEEKAEVKGAGQQKPLKLQPLLTKRPSILPPIGENQVRNDFPAAEIDEEDQEDNEKWVPLVAIPSPPDGGWGWVSISHTMTVNKKIQDTYIRFSPT